MTHSTMIILILGIGFGLLVIFALFLVIAAIKTLRHVDTVLTALHRQINSVEEEPRRLIRNVNEISENLHHKMKCLDAIFNSISIIGEGVENKVLNYKIVQKQNEEIKDVLIIELFEFVLKAISLWQNFKKRS